jgi:hypothetical protein
MEARSFNALLGPPGFAEYHGGIEERILCGHALAVNGDAGQQSLGNLPTTVVFVFPTVKTCERLDTPGITVFVCAPWHIK